MLICCSWRTTIFDRVSIFVEYSRDIIHFHDTIPGFDLWSDVPKEADIKTGLVRYGAWLTNVQRMAIPYKLASEMIMTRRATVIPDPVTGWERLIFWCPKLEELVILIGDEGPCKAEKTYAEDWKELSRWELPVEPWKRRWETPNFASEDFKAFQLPPAKSLLVRFVSTD